MKNRETKNIIAVNSFDKVLSIIEDGYSISKALEKLSINRTVFYANISLNQKRELQLAKTATTKYGIGKWKP